MKEAFDLPDFYKRESEKEFAQLQTHANFYGKKHDSENRTKCMKSHFQVRAEMSPNQGSSSICPGEFQNFYGPLTPLYLLFSPFFIGISKRLSSACPSLFWVYVGQKTCNLVHRPIDQGELDSRCLRNYIQGSLSTPGLEIDNKFLDFELMLSWDETSGSLYRGWVYFAS